jgi:hypothetical protein
MRAVSYDSYIDICKMGFKRSTDQMLILDFLILNEDRHA